MKVRELIEKLRGLDPELPILHSEDADGLEQSMMVEWVGPMRYSGANRRCYAEGSLSKEDLPLTERVVLLVRKVEG